MNRSTTLFFSVAFIAVVSAANRSVAAGTVVVPNALADAEGETGLSSVFRSGAARTYQMQIAAAELSTIPVGAAIHAVAFRLSGTSGSLFSLDISEWNLTLAQAAHSVSNASSVFADNMVNPVLVRSGPMSFPNGSYPNDGHPNAFGPLISFSTPYRYAGDDLIVHLTHNGGTAFVTPTFMDATFGAGYGTLFAASNADSFNAISANYAIHEAFVVTQFAFSEVPEASASTLCGAAVAGQGAMRRRRSRRFVGRFL